MRRNDFCMTRLVDSGKGFGDAAHVVEELVEQSSQRQPRRQDSGDLLRLTGYLQTRKTCASRLRSRSPGRTTQFTIKSEQPALTVHSDHAHLHIQPSGQLSMTRIPKAASAPSVRNWRSPHRSMRPKPSSISLEYCGLGALQDDHQQPLQVRSR